MNDALMTFWQGRLSIGIKQMLETGAFPFADKLLQSLEADEKEQQDAMAQQQAGGMQTPPQLDQEAVQQLYSQANPQAMEMINKGLQQ